MNSRLSIPQRIVRRVRLLRLRFTTPAEIPPYEEKRQIIDFYRRKFGARIFVETGTFMGETVEAFRNDFDRLISIELNLDLAARAQRKFAAISNISILQGDSGILLNQIVRDLQEPALFWLDGHYSGEFTYQGEFIATAKGDKETPVIEELTAVLGAPRRHTALVDDARCFNGLGDYPTIGQLRKLVRKTRRDYQLILERDIIRITPPG